MKSIRILTFAALAVSAPAGAFAQATPEAVRALEYEQYGAARNAFTSAYRSDASAENAFNLAVFYFTVDQADSARTILQQAIAADDRNPYLHVGMGELELIARNGDAAEKHFEQAEKLSRKRDAGVFYQIGMAYLRSSEDYNEAVDAFDQATKIDNKNARYYTALGDAYLEMNDASKASLNYEQAVYFDAKYAPAYARLGELYVRAKNYNEAIRRLRQAVEIDPDYTPAYKEMSELYYLGRQFRNAAENLQEYLKRGQGTRDDLFQLAGFLYLDNQFDESLKTLQQVGTDYPNPIVHRLYAYNYYRTEQNQPGYEQINLFLQRAKPEDLLADDYEIHGRLGLATGADTAAALASLRKAAEIDTAKTGLLREVAQVLYERGQYVESAQVYGEMAAKGVDLSATDYFRQGQGYYFGRDYQNAVPAFTAVTEAAASNNLGWLYLARTNAQIDSTQEQGLAKPAYEKYIEVTTEREKYKDQLIEANYYLGSFAWMHGDKENAEKHLNEVLALDPEHANAKALIDAVAAGQFGEFADGDGTSQQ